MGKGGFSFWAYYQGLGAGAALLCGGPLCLFYPMWFLGPYAMCSPLHIGVGLLVLLLEYPPAWLPRLLGAAYANYLVRGILYLFLSSACSLQAANLNGGMFLTTTGITYMVAHFQDEKYTPPRPHGFGNARGPRANAVSARTGASREPQTKV
ncbi:hypothetical protein AMAG_06439 [Allomyces macrogynus ATCC 38327]|uniref:Uncharacterized protein n=1 Tax=Allomyces macrogynus (strain ATCC 38327) TaxID=578462 RepID=A0A0L0SGQ3_ALLM3|nr:hypothetical protein AMAG_06439 [Allomyces macrogynus ATCC 38327]|eukprot:KNE61629.1 hypothetical protein AMAG_06439 [Allomyces macrogynus ATCC 38327]